MIASRPTLADLRLILGRPRTLAARLWGLARMLRGLVLPAERNRRIDAFVGAGALARRPTTGQLWRGTARMVRHYRLPFAPDFYYPQGKPSLWRRLGPHLWEPCGLIDHSGLHTPLDRFVNHALVISHEDFRYDFEMLRAVPGGVEALESALRGVLDGTHPEAEAIRRIVEDPDYHKRLLAALAAWRAAPDSTEPFHLLPPSPEHADAYRAYDRFHSLAGFLRYCLTL